MTDIAQDALIPDDAQIAEVVVIGPRAVLAGRGIVLRSVPAYAIVEGNPAQVVGYVTPTGDGARPAPRLIDVAAYRDLPRPARVPPDVGDSALYLMRRVTDARGALSVGEVPTEVTLDRPDMDVFMPAMIWGTQYRYSRDAVLLVFASRPYEVQDYIRDYETFQKRVSGP